MAWMKPRMVCASSTSPALIAPMAFRMSSPVRSAHHRTRAHVTPVSACVPPKLFPPAHRSELTGDAQQVVLVVDEERDVLHATRQRREPR
mgnify:CR=1 FL=1